MADKGNAKAERRREDAGGIKEFGKDLKRSAIALKDKAYAKAKEQQPVGGGLLGGKLKQGGKPLAMKKYKPKPMTQKGNKAKTKSMTAKSITAEKLLKGRKPK